MGVERDPGQTTASVSPLRTHSSTSVAQKVALYEPDSSSTMSAAYGPGPTTPTLGDVPTESLASVSTGGGRRRVTMLHGFTQSARCWGPFAEILESTCSVTAVDLPGHGASGDVRADLPTTAALVADRIGPSVVIGYSLGGRVALHLALARPDLVERLVLVSTTAGIDDVDERDRRRADDDRLADHIEEIGVDAFLDAWLAQPLFAGLTPEAALVDCRRNNTASGLASSLRLCGTGTQEPLWDRLSTIAVPVLVVVGERDDKFRILGDRLATSIGSNAAVIVIDDAGHSTPLERPEATAAAILHWLDLE